MALTDLGAACCQVYTGVNLKEMENFHPFRYLLSYLSECTQKFGQLQELAAAGGEVRAPAGQARPVTARVACK
eukprot:scaffold886_cov317-Prasinococcus_capsulatus_cf.AAC.4